MALALFASRTSPASGTWLPLTNLAPAQLDTMLLLSDGTVMATDGGNGWYRLTPDISGSYVNGVWSTLASMQSTRLYFSSDMLTNGQVFVAGGEYGTGSATAEVYDPVTNVWIEAPPSGQIFDDSISTILPDGTVLIAPDVPSVPETPVIYDPASNDWWTGPVYYQGNGQVNNQSEASWVKLADNSILTLDPLTTNSERFIPSLHQWVGDAEVPVPLYDDDGEIGPAVLLPGGRAIFFGSTGNTAIYTPSGTTNAGSWIAGPEIPYGFFAEDNPCAMMVNGKILCAFGPYDRTIDSTSFFEYDPATNAFTSVDGPTGPTFPVISYALRMLDLPDGTVLMSISDTQLYVYVPDGSPVAAGKPAITSIATNPDGSYLLTGTLLNGISAGAVYGDDAQMDSNYPLVRLTDANGNVYYARTANWSSTGVMTGNTPVTTQFWLPSSLPVGTYSLVVVANGNSSQTVEFNHGVPLVLKTMGMTNGFLSLAWNAVAGQTYHIQYQTDFTQTNWQDLCGAIMATNHIARAVDTNIACAQKFYRISHP